MTDVLRYVKGLTRFNYWNYPVINPPLEQRAPPFDAAQYAIVDGVDDVGSLAHKRLSARYRKAHHEGDPEAIFTYVKADVWAFRASWVVRQIEAWRLEATADSRAKLQRLMRMYTDDRGRDSLGETVRLIKRDQAIFQEIITLHEEQHLPFRSSRGSDDCFTRIAQKYPLSAHSAEEIYRKYKQKADELMTGYRRLPPPKIRTALEKHVAATSGEQLDWEALEIRRQHHATPRLSSWEELFGWLDTMAERLTRLVGGEKPRF